MPDADVVVANGLVASPWFRATWGGDDVDIMMEEFDVMEKVLCVSTTRISKTCVEYNNFDTVGQTPVGSFCTCMA